MKLIRTKILLITFLGFTSLFCEAQITLSSEFFPPVISINGYTSYRIVIENSKDVSEIMPPSFSDFVIVSGPHQDGGALINGKRKHCTVISFVLKPIRPGKVTMGSAYARINGKMMKTPQAQLIVNGLDSTSQSRSNESTNPNPVFNDYIFLKGDDTLNKVDKNVYLRLVVNKKQCYVGEPLVAAYKLFTRLKCESHLSQNPSFNGFSVIDLANDISELPTVEKWNGRDYNVYTIRKVQLYPLQAGVFNLETAELENEIEFIREEYAQAWEHNQSALFEDFSASLVPSEAIIRRRVTLRNSPESIRVAPLPELNKPKSFHGAVGKFYIRSVLSKENLFTDENGKLIIIVEGSGNMQLLNTPEISWPAGFEPFEPSIKEEIDKSAIPVKGKKIFEYPFTVSFEGNYRLPSVSLSYFDPDKSEYETVSTLPIEIFVSKGNNNSANQSKIKNLMAEPDAKDFLKKYSLLFISAGCLLLALAIIFYTNRRNKREKIKESELKRVAASKAEALLENTAYYFQDNPFPLSEKKLAANDVNEFYSTLNNELKHFLGLRFKLESYDFNPKILSASLDKTGISNKTCLELLNLINEIELQVYAHGGLQGKMSEHMRKAQELAQVINTHGIKPR